MEMELKNIIDKIKREGVTEAEKEAAEIKRNAEEEAGKIIAAAEAGKEEMLKLAEEASSKLKKNAEDSIRQASRDAVLGLRDNIVKMFDAVMKQQVDEQLTPEVMQKMIIKLTESMTKDKAFDIEIILSEKDRKTLEDVLLNELKKAAKKGVSLKAAPGVEHGFRIGEKGGNAYYDFTGEAVTEAFKAYLNPKMASLLVS